MQLDDEEEKLREVALQNAGAILRARERAEQQLLETREALRQSAERLKLALAAGQLGDWSWVAASDEVFLGDAAAGMFGLAPGTRITWAGLRESLHEEDREPARRAVEEALSGRTDYDLRYRVIHPSGGQRWLAARGRGSYAEDGRVLGMTGVLQDITERKRIEDALQEETAVLELLNRTGAAIASQLDLQSLVQTVTDGATELTGAKFGAFFYNVIDQAGESFLLYALSGAPREAFDEFGLPRNTPVFDRTFRGEGVLRSEDITKDARYGRIGPHHGMPKGHLPVCSYLAVPVVARSGEVIGGLFFGHPEPGVFTERSERLVVGMAAQAAVAIDNARLFEAAQKAAEERKRLLESERAARAETERMSELKDEFLATLSHELRTPLSAILGWSQVLRRGSIDADGMKQAVETIERNARLQAQLIEDLLDMSRITSGKLRLDVQNVMPSTFIEAAIDTVHPAATAKGIRIEKLLDPGAGPVSGDPGRLQQVMWNLLSNAIKFTGRGGKVQVRLERVNSHIEISVADTGIGLKPEFLTQVFERFRQLDSTSTRRYSGLGLGLSIVRNLVELHGGRVRASSAGEGQGATFAVELPLTILHGRERFGLPRQHPKALKEPVDYRLADLSGLRILVVDDEADARALLQRVLTDCKAEVTAAPDASQALGLVERERFDLLVSDIGMPGMDGYELLRRVRALGAEKGGRVPAIALTAFARSEDRTRALTAGFLVHVSKPVEPSELVATVASVAGRTGA